jgi:hypothetical protein
MLKKLKHSIAKSKTVLKVLSLAAVLSAATTVHAQAQWLVSGSNIYLNTIYRNVGIGTQTPNEQLQIHNPNTAANTDNYIALSLTTGGNGNGHVGECSRKAMLAIANQAGYYSDFSDPGDVVLMSAWECGEDLILTTRTKSSGAIRFGGGYTGGVRGDNEKMAIFEENYHTIVDMKNTNPEASTKNIVLRMYTAQPSQGANPQHGQPVLGKDLWKIGLNGLKSNSFNIEPTVAQFSNNAEFNSPALTILPDRSVGIGTDNPTMGSQPYDKRKLYIKSQDKEGGIHFDYSPNADWTYGMQLVMNGKPADNTKAFVITSNDKEWYETFQIYGSGDCSTIGRMSIGDGDRTAPVKKPGGTNADYRLSVDGKIVAHELVCTVDNWADFVFADDYKLMSLDEVATHIEKEKHLPGIPSATEVAANGVSIGEMQAKLLQKVEELTLYVLAQDKRLKQLEVENEQLRQFTGDK